MISDSRDVCSKRKCPKFKVCVENIQGLAICTCPSEFICGRKRRLGERSRDVQTVAICGSDGVTYPSRCHLKIANCNSNRRIKRKHDGPCKENSSESTTVLVTDKVTDPNTTFEATRTAPHRKNGKPKKSKTKKRNGKGRTWKRQRKEKRREKKKQRSRRTKRRNNDGYMLSGGFGYLAGNQPRWSRQQVRKSRI